MFLSSLQIYLWLCSKTHHCQWNMGEYSPFLDLSPPFSYNTSPHRKIINRWVGWERLPARAARHLGKQASLLWFPCWREEGRPQLDCPSHWVEPEKLDWNYRYLSLPSPHLLDLHTSFNKSGHTNQGTESKTIFIHRKHQWKLLFFTCSWILGTVAVCDALRSQLGNLWEWCILPGLWAQACARVICRQTQTINYSVSQ